MKSDTKDEEWRKEWIGMPEFVQESQKPYAKIIVRFADAQALEEFAFLVSQKLTNKTKSMWYPELVIKKGGIWVDESETSNIHSLKGPLEFPSYPHTLLLTSYEWKQIKYAPQIIERSSFWFKSEFPTASEVRDILDVDKIMVDDSDMQDSPYYPE